MSGQNFDISTWSTIHSGNSFVNFSDRKLLKNKGIDNKQSQLFCELVWSDLWKKPVSTIQSGNFLWISLVKNLKNKQDQQFAVTNFWRVSLVGNLWKTGLSFHGGSFFANWSGHTLELVISLNLLLSSIHHGF